MRRTFILALVFLVPVVSSQTALARRAVLVPTVQAAPDAPEGVGCYFERGRTHCSRYCYIEVDGHRFCRERARDAHSQAPVPELYVGEMPPMVLTPMK